MLKFAFKITFDLIDVLFFVYANFNFEKYWVSFKEIKRNEKSSNRHESFFNLPKSLGCLFKLSQHDILSCLIHIESSIEGRINWSDNRKHIFSHIMGIPNSLCELWSVADVCF